MKLLARTILASLSVILLVGCGGGNKPSEDALTKFVMDNADSYSNLTGDMYSTTGGEDGHGGTPKFKTKTAKCVAKALRSSDVSAEALTAIVDGDAEYQPSAGDTEALKSVGNKIRKDCTEKS